MVQVLALLKQVTVVEMVALVVCSHVPLVSQTFTFQQSFAEGGEEEELDVPFSSIEPDLLNTLFEVGVPSCAPVSLSDAGSAHLPMIASS